MKKILVIDDDVHISDMIEEALTREGYSILKAYSGTEALYVLSKTSPDLILLDLMLPGLSGEELLPKIKDIPVIVISAKLDVDNKVRLLLDGAADYITKPFDLSELKARIIVALRSSHGKAGVMEFGDISLDASAHSVSVSGEPVRLTRTEYAILKLLISNPEQVITKSNLLDKISMDTPDCTETSLKMHVSNLRRKLRDISGKDYIESVWGIGFKLRLE